MSHCCCHSQFSKNEWCWISFVCFMLSAYHLWRNVCSFSFSLFFSLFWLGNLYFSIFMFTDSFLCPLNSAMQPIHGVDFWYCFFSSKIFIWFFFFVEIFYFVICFKHICNCLLKHFYRSYFKIFVLTSVSSQCWCLLTVFSYSSWDFLGSWYDKWFCIETWTF